MNNIKTTFSIKDLENLSGIKAHTIRIWEKRYNILEPNRTDTNIRLYDTVNLQKLLNVTLLTNHGYKISKISQYPAEKIPILVSEIVSEKTVKNHAISAFKMAMMHFDQTLFFATYDKLLSEKSFREVFYEVFLPLIEEVGMLWQTDTITPAHEHFISHLIKQKLLINIATLQIQEPVIKDKVFVLFLPMHEIHDLGLMYINYEILLQGYQTIFLGESLPMENLLALNQTFDNVTFVSYFTVEPNQNEVNNYIQEIKQKVLKDSSKIWIAGRLSSYINPSILDSKVEAFPSIAALVSQLHAITPSV